MKPIIAAPPPDPDANPGADALVAVLRILNPLPAEGRRRVLDAAAAYYREYPDRD